MKKYKLLIISLLLIVSLAGKGQYERPKQYMLQSKFKGMYLRISDDKVPIATPYYYGHYFFIHRGEITRAFDYREEEEIFLQLAGDKLIFDTQRALTQEESRQLQIEAMSETPQSESQVKLPVHKSSWYFEPAGDDGSVYIICPYEPYVGFCLTINTPINDTYHRVELEPKKPGLNDDQKWQFIYVPHTK